MGKGIPSIFAVTSLIIPAVTVRKHFPDKKKIPEFWGVMHFFVAPELDL